LRRGNSPRRPRPVRLRVSRPLELRSGDSPLRARRGNSPRRSPSVLHFARPWTSCAVVTAHCALDHSSVARILGELRSGNSPLRPLSSPVCVLWHATLLQGATTGRSKKKKSTVSGAVLLRFRESFNLFRAGAGVDCATSCHVVCKQACRDLNPVDLTGTPVPAGGQSTPISDPC
jgi:hypothetical protein